MDSVPEPSNATRRSCKDDARQGCAVKVPHARGALCPHVFQRIYGVKVVKVSCLIRATLAHGEFEVTLVSLRVYFYRPVGCGGRRCWRHVGGREFCVFLRRQTGSGSGRIRVPRHGDGDSGGCEERRLHLNEIVRGTGEIDGNCNRGSGVCETSVIEEGQGVTVDFDAPVGVQDPRARQNPGIRLPRAGEGGARQRPCVGFASARHVLQAGGSLDSEILGGGVPRTIHKEGE